MRSEKCEGLAKSCSSGNQIPREGMLQYVHGFHGYMDGRTDLQMELHSKTRVSGLIQLPYINEKDVLFTGISLEMTYLLNTISMKALTSGSCFILK
jgi:hypothetical protein